MRIRLVVALLCSLAPVSCQRTGVSGLYEDRQHRFALQVPAGWSATPLNADAVQLSNGAAYVTAMVGPGDDPQSLLDTIAQQAGRQWQGFKEARRGGAKLAGRIGAYVTYAGTNPRGSEAYLQMMAASEQGNTYVLMMSAPKAEYAKLKSAFDSVENSFRIGPVPVASAAPSPAARASGNYYRMKKVSVVDEHGFERPMPAISLLVPVDWRFAGHAQYNTKTTCTLELVNTSFQAQSPDGHEALEMFPNRFWQWADDRNLQQAMHMTNQQSAQFGMKGCDIAPAANAADYVQRVVIPTFRRGARVVSVEPLPAVLQKAQDQARQIEANAARAGMRNRIQVDAARVLVQYEVNGQAVDEWLSAVTFASGVPAPSFNMQTGQMGQTTSYTCGAYNVFGYRAPRGQLPGRDRFVQMMLATLQPNPEWQARVQQVQTNIQASQIKGARDRSEIIRRSNEEVSGIIRDTYENRQRSQDRTSAQFSQYIRGVETYKNPQTGETVELSNQYGHAWVNGRNEYLLSDSPGFDPNVALHENWTALEHVRQ